jgi:hypothetical protein
MPPGDTLKSEASYHVWRLLDVLLPHGGFVVLFESFGDASGTHKEADLLSVALFLFEKEASRALHEEWNAILWPILRDLPEKKRYFRMAKFMEREEPYHLLNGGERDSLRRRLIDSAHTHATVGVVASMRKSEYEAEISPESRKLLGSPFTALYIWLMEQIASHASSVHKEAAVAYIIEAGDLDQDELEQALKAVSRDLRLSERCRYSGHSFQPKWANHALGAADMLAWEYRKGIERHLDKPDSEFGPRDIFLNVIFQNKVRGMHFSPTTIKIWEMVESRREGL